MSINPKQKGKRFVSFFLLLLFCSLMNHICAQNTAEKKVSYKCVKEKLSVALEEIEKASGYYKIDFVASEVKDYIVTVEFKDLTVLQAVRKLIEGKPLDVTTKDKTILIRRQDDRKSKEFKVKGVVKDSQGEPIIGAFIKNVGSTSGTSSDEDGMFTLSVKDESEKIEVSFIGMKSVVTKPVKGKVLNIVLEEDNTAIDEVVITGIYTRKKESFSGSSKTYKGEELKNIGTQNIIQGLKTLDAAFAVIENNLNGSDPNKLPDLEIRGKSSIVGLKEQFGEDPNQPLFILDGFEAPLQTIMDLSIDRVATVTILKDAASTAIYGAKAANGVVVVETKVPQVGKLKFSYNGNYGLTFADLSDYNLMNAAEKLEYERLAGNFKSNLVGFEELKQKRYNKLLANVKRGVDTYWLSEPLRLGINQNHNVYAEGGDDKIRYGIGASYNNIEGVMKKSSRRVLNGHIDLIYRVGKLSFSNKLSIGTTKHNNPIVSFATYAKSNPYYPKRNEGGTVEKWLEYKEGGNNSIDASVNMGNPLWNDHLNSYNKGDAFNIRNNFNIEYRPFSFLFIRGRFGIDKATRDSESFTSPKDTSFDETEVLQKGSYSDNRSDSFGYDGDFSATYGQYLNDAHQINAVLGASIRENKSIYKGFSAVGFPEGNFNTPGFANSYPKSGKPSYGDYKNRSANFFMNAGYSYKNRYLFDGNIRMDGSSVFGSNRQFTTTWAVGIAWNLHNEKFIKDISKKINMLQLRTSIGNPGNQNFGSYNTITTYKYNNWMQNIFGTGVIVDRYGDPNLEWQKTLDFNIGMNISLFNRLHLNVDYYHKETDPLLASIGIPLSVGIRSRLANIGKQVNKGINGTIRYSFIYRPKERINWTTSLSFRSMSAYYDNIGNKLDQYNKENIRKNLVRYYNGGSPTAMWSVRSAGIDPATGREIFIKKDGTVTFFYSYEDEVIVGNSIPDIEGVIGNNFYWKGFTFSLYVRYSLGSQSFNSTLYRKVENISSQALVYNQDKRALYDRWKKPGDISKYKGISLTDYTPMSSRFVQDNNYISLESIRIGYELPRKAANSLGISGARISAYMNNIGRFSTIKEERGINYPFARSVSMSLSINF